MSAREEMATMLNELMGPSRNDDVDRSVLNYKDDAEVCKFFLASFCPHELFVNTRADLGPCPYYHDENIRIAYRNSRDFERLGYERSFYRFLSRMHDDMSRKIQKHKDRLALTQNHVGKVDDATRDRLNDKLANIAIDMANCLEEAEKAGNEGDLERSRRFAKQVDDLRAESEKVRRMIDGKPEPSQLPAGVVDPNAPKPMKVCETCGCFLIIGDVQQRIDEHYSGKQHIGYAKIAETMNELRERLRQIDEVDDERRRRRSRSSTRERYMVAAGGSSSSSSHKKSSSSGHRTGNSRHHPLSSSKRSRSRSRDRTSRHDSGRSRHQRRSRSCSRDRRRR